MFRRADRLRPIPPTLGAVGDAERGSPVGTVRPKLHSFPGSQSEGELHFELQRDSRILLRKIERLFCKVEAERPRACQSLAKVSMCFPRRLITVFMRKPSACRLLKPA